MYQFIGGGKQGSTVYPVILGLGLSDADISRLKEGKPISVRLADFGLKVDNPDGVSDVQVVIFYGEEHEKLIKESIKGDGVGHGD